MMHGKAWDMKADQRMRENRDGTRHRVDYAKLRLGKPVPPFKGFRFIELLAKPGVAMVPNLNVRYIR
jgi:hypothetical protein